MPFGRGRYKRGAPPSKPGVYRYVDKATNNIDYEGQSGNLSRRYKEHINGAPPAFDPNTHHFDYKEQT